MLTIRCKLVMQLLFGIVTINLIATSRAAETNPRVDALSANVWRREHRLIDMHMHIEGLPERYRRQIKTMDGVGLGVGIELGSGTVPAISGKRRNLQI